MALFLLWLLFGIGLFIQIVFLTAIFGRVAFGKSKIPIALDSSKQEGVTVLVAAHNESGRLKHLIPVLFQQNYQNFDVLIVNDRSNDRTRRLLEDFSNIYPRLQIVTVDYTPDHLTSKKYALTLGIKASKNDIILLTEADCMPQSQDWIAKMTAPIRERNKIFSIGFSGYERKPGFLNSWIQFETILSAMFYLSFGIWKKPFTGIGKNLSYRRSFFMDAKAFKGFWKVIAGDDELFVNQHVNGKNSEIVLDPEAITISRPKTTFRDYLLQKKKHFQARKHYRKDSKIITGFYGLSHTLFWIGSLGLMVYFGIQQNWEQLLTVLSITLLRSSLLLIVFSLARKKIQGIKGVINTFLHDLVYLGYFWLIGSFSQLVKEIKWK
jgi:cellulose synthase/poly-beta-1,6-N-acetylglucosamine synthase-like glycosyltransferase